MPTMQALVFRSVNAIGIEEVTRSPAEIGQAVIKITLTTICGTDARLMGASSASTAIRRD
ncbi:MAG: hypothetical protein H8K10_19920 [Nitrospira sp.]|nr:hypothetical protein [Nitrospira sp.]